MQSQFSGNRVRGSYEEVAGSPNELRRRPGFQQFKLQRLTSLILRDDFPIAQMNTSVEMADDFLIMGDHQHCSLP